MKSFFHMIVKSLAEGKLFGTLFRCVKNGFVLLKRKIGIWIIRRRTPVNKDSIIFLPSG